MRPKRPINADVPAPEETREQAPATERSEAPLAPPKPEPKAGEAQAAKPGAAPGEKPQVPAKPEPSKPKAERPPRKPESRQPKSATPKLLGGLVVLALVFIVAAIVGSSGGGGQDETEATAPGPTAAPAAPEKSGGGEAATQATESLGFPGFATDNTTRIGGSDPAATAAATALAVFPSTTPSQRPAAVALASEEDWAGAIAASVLMAPPVRAPLLFSGANEVPAATEEALAALQPQGAKETGGAAYFAIGSVALPDGAAAVTRVGGGDAASTAARIAALRDRLFKGPPQAIVVASSSKPDFAMPAAAWAARSGDPVLYAEADALPKPTEAALKRHPKVPVYVLGPPAAVSAKVLAQIGKVAQRVKRVAGKDAVGTAIALARYGDGGFGWNVNDPGHGFVLARSDSPQDAAAAAPLSAAGTWGPLLLTDNAARLPAKVRSYLLDVKPGYTTNPTRAFYNHVWVIGDQEAIDVNQQAEVNELAELAKIGGEG